MENNHKIIITDTRLASQKRQRFRGKVLDIGLLRVLQMGVTKGRD
jgi:hypothetical protein